MMILALNVKGLGDLDKALTVTHLLRDHRVDVAFLCETHLTNERTAVLKERFLILL
jgi:hypothetical protein